MSSTKVAPPARWDLLAEEVAHTRGARRLVGQSPPMRQLRELIERMATVRSPVLITGETGAGKGVAALAIHEESARADGPFVAVNCATATEAVLERELFGHSSSVFSSPSPGWRGLFVEADGGSLFLDEVAALPLPLQGQLLGVLQSGEVHSAGGRTMRKVDVRCIAATSGNLPALVAIGLFREDLFHRLDVLHVAVPPLREHLEDVPALVDHFVTRSRSLSPWSPLLALDPEGVAFLSDQAWPGNVRHLENLIERLVVTATRPHARLADVAAALRTERDTDPFDPLILERRTWQEVKERYIDAILERFGGNKTRAAEILGVDASTLYRRD